MADVVYSTDPLMGLYQDHSDIRREAAEHTYRQGNLDTFRFKEELATKTLLNNVRTKTKF